MVLGFRFWGFGLRVTAPVLRELTNPIKAALPISTTLACLRGL